VIIEMMGYDLLTKGLCKLYIKNPSYIDSFQNIRFNLSDSTWLKKYLKEHDIYDYKDKILIIKSQKIGIINLFKYNNKDYCINIKELIEPKQKSIILLIRFRELALSNPSKKTKEDRYKDWTDFYNTIEINNIE
jgi:hypothetical protein